MRLPKPVSSTNMKDNLPLSLFIYDLKSCAPFTIIEPALMLVTSITLGSYHSMKSQLFIPLDGTPVKYRGISTVSPTLASTLATVNVVPSPAGGVDGVGFGDDVGCDELKLTPPSSNLNCIRFKS